MSFIKSPMCNQVLILYGCLLAFRVAGQCPDRDTLWNRLVFLSNNASAAYTSSDLNAQLAELTGYEVKLQGCNYRNDSTHAFLLQRIGSIYYKQGEFIKAIGATRRSIALLDSRGGKPSLNPANQVKNYYNLSVYWAALDRATEKLSAIDSCITIAIRTKQVNYTPLYALVERTQYFFDVGDYDRCMQYASLGESVTAQYVQGADSIAFAINFAILKVNALLKFGNYEEAELLLSQKINACKRAGAKEHLGTIYEILAELTILQNSPRQALSYFREAIKYDREAGFKLGCMQTLNNLGFYFYHKYYRDTRQAVMTYNEALSYASHGEQHDDLERLERLNIYTNIALAYLQSGRYDQAFKHFRLAFEEIGKGVDENALLDSSGSFVLNKKIEYITGLVREKADAFLQQYKSTGNKSLLGEALRIYKVGDQLLDRFRSRQYELRSKLLWRFNARRLYEHAIEAAFLDNNAIAGLYFFEKARSVLLMDQLSEQHLFGGEEILQQVQLKKKILQLETESGNAALPAGRLTEIQHQRYVSNQELDRLLRIIRERNPLYYQGLTDSSMVTLEELRRRILPGHEAMVELFTGDSAVYVLTITGRQVGFTKIDKTDFDSTVNTYISYVSDAALLNAGFGHFTKISHKLYNLIFREIDLPPGRVIVSPDGAYFPFESLVTRFPGVAPHYFLNDHAVSYAYSANYLVNGFGEKNRASVNDFMGVAPVQFSPGLKLGALPGSDHSLHKLKNYFKRSEILLAEDATKNNFLNNFYKYRIIQLYTHASDSGRKGEPVIYFADSALQLSELIPGNSPVTTLVVLSACETAGGRIYQGEGVFSFNRGFAALGIPTAVSNLWAVDNLSTYRLTELFYKYLSQGITSDVALQKAKLEFMETASREKQLPFFWAAPILAGKAGALDVNEAYNWKIIALLIIIAGLVLLAVHSRNNPRRTAEV